MKGTSMNCELLNAYFAGLIDGEGCMNVYPHKQNKYMRPVVKVNMTCAKTIKALHEHFGGSFMEKKTKEGNKKQWHWIVTHNKAIDVTKLIRPYLITKAEFADKILKCKKGKQGVKRQS